MSKKVSATGKQKSMLMMHTELFAIVTAITWMVYDKGAHGWAYPWPAWTTAAWGLFLLGHFCIVYSSYEDAGYTNYRKQQGYNS